MTSVAVYLQVHPCGTPCTEAEPALTLADAERVRKECDAENPDLVHAVVAYVPAVIECRGTAHRFDLGQPADEDGTRRCDRCAERAIVGHL